MIGEGGAVFCPVRLKAATRAGMKTVEKEAKLDHSMKDRPKDYTDTLLLSRGKIGLI